MTLERSAKRQSKSSQEQWQGANAALMELEKGLRSSKSGEQCESIVRFPDLFAKYPFPIVVNAGFLKLADVFRGGTTFMKLCVLKVIQGCDTHLDKVLNVEEFLRRILGVTHSNDPVARAIALRVLGSIASIISEKKSVHHCLRSGLDSHNQVEIEAAVFATKSFSQQSSDFAEGISHKIGDMIEDLSVPTDMKLKLIPIMEHMHHNIRTANMVRDLCVGWLESYSSQTFVLVILHTLTALASSTLINIPEQVDRLLIYLQHDSRLTVKLKVLKDMLKLTSVGAHLWKAEHVQQLTTFAMETSSGSLQTGCLLILKVLSGCVHLAEAFDDRVLHAQEVLFNSACLQNASLTLEIRIMLLKNKGRLSDDRVSTCKSDLEFTIQLAAAEQNLSVVKRCLSCIKVMCQCQKHQDVYFSTFLVDLMPSLHRDVFIEVCHCLVAINTSVAALPTEKLPALVKLFNDSIDRQSEGHCSDIVVGLATLIFQSSIANNTKPQITFQSLIATKDWWLMYRIARQAAQIGCAEESHDLFSCLTKKATAEKFYLWLSSLSRLMRAEALFASDCSTASKLTSRLTEAQKLYRQAIVDMRASVSPGFSLAFQQQYAKLRADAFRAYRQLMVCCASLKTCPPPMVATTDIFSGANEMPPTSLPSQFQACASTFRNLRNSYGELYSASFNANKSTLDNLAALQGQCTLVAYAIDKLVSNNSSVGSNLCRDGEDPALTFNKRFFSHSNSVGQMLLEEIQQLSEDTIGHQLNHLQIACIQRVVCTQLAMPLPYPLYFFKQLQDTRIKLSVSATGQEQSENITICTDTQLVVQIEGLVDNSKSQVVFRSVEKVLVTVKVVPTNQTTDSSKHQAKLIQTHQQLQQTLDLHHGYFSTQFLVVLAMPGNHEVYVSTGVYDGDNVLWSVGSSATLAVRSYDAPLARHNRPL